MVRSLLPEEFVERAQETPVLDVRSPGEYRLGHLSQAISFPLFNDQERAEVGTLYKQVGQMEAVERGLEIVGGKMREMFAQGLGYAKEGKLLVHCWRGGKRSESVANLMAVAGLDVAVLKGGYKAYRNWVLGKFSVPEQFLVLGGLTGSGKTRVLHRLQALGQAVLDIEDRAAHRGSAFGRLGQNRYVAPQQFENEMAQDLHLLHGRSIWLEDESRVLGGLILPPKLWEQKQAAPVFFIEIPDEERVRLLMEDYGSLDHGGVASSINKISEKLGGLRTKQALEALESNQGEVLTRMLLDYYDKLYLNSLREKPKETAVHHLTFDRFDLDEIATALLEKAHSLGYAI